jgi:hypothetical protein
MVRRRESAISNQEARIGQSGGCLKFEWESCPLKLWRSKWPAKRSREAAKRGALAGVEEAF